MKMHLAALIAGIFCLVPSHPQEGSSGEQAPKNPPNYGGSLNVVTIYPTLGALSWDPEDWAWKTNHDAGMMYEQLFAADLNFSKHKDGPYAFIAEAYLPTDAIRGELAESWEWVDPLTLVIHLRHGIMFPEKPGVMKSRELIADDVEFSFYRQKASPKKIPTYFDHIDAVTAQDSHTVVFNFNRFNAEWIYRFGYGFYSPIMPREMGDVNAKDWRNIVGSGPFQLTRNIQANSQIYQRNPGYWDTENIEGEEYQIPFIDKMTYRVIKDEATRLTALRTGKIDILEYVRWIALDHLKETTPELQWSRYMSTNGTFLSMRMDQKPFDDVRVRRAMNLAIDQREIVELFYGGHAELFGYPIPPDFVGYYKPLEEMPDSVQELFTYNPEKARQLLAEAGYPDGFTFTTQFCVCTVQHPELVPLLTSYLAKVGVTMELEQMEYAAFLSAMTTRTLKSGYLLDSGHTTPTTTIRKSFGTGQTWNPSQFSDPVFDEKIVAVHLERNEEKRQKMIQDMTVEMLDLAPYIWLPNEYRYTAWWPWVKNYSGGLRAGAARPGPIYARIWIDEELKKELGF